MGELEVQFRDDTLVWTEDGIVRLADILGRPVEKSLWAIKWALGDAHNGISFHKNHKIAVEFAKVQMDSQPETPARLVPVSDWLYDKVQKCHYYWTDLKTFAEAKTYGGPKWNH